MEYKDSLKLYQELLETNKSDDQSIIHAHILHNINSKLIDKLHKLETRMDRRFDKIERYGLWLKYLVYIWASCMLFQTLYKAFT